MPDRRQFLQMGLTGLGGLSLANLQQLRASSVDADDQRPTAMIVVFLHGGASHLETWDPKPEAPSEYRGPFGTIETKTPGLRFCDLLPRQAAISDRFTILRSMVHTGICHGIGQQQMFSGDEIREFKPKADRPEFLTITNQVRGPKGRVLPNYVGAPPIPYLGAAYLGPTCEPFAVNADPNLPDFTVPNMGALDQTMQSRLRRRLDLRGQLDTFRQAADSQGNMRAIESFDETAWNMLTSQETRKAFDLSQEKTSVRDDYGRNTWGQRCLLARRLVEAGVELVAVTLAGPICGRVNSWDDHAVNHHIFNELQSRAPLFDQAVAALVSDIYDRGLDQRVMVIVTGEFGRTPKISYAADTETGVMQPGRDHWPHATSMMFAGGGIKTGQVIGATDARGEEVIERRIGPHDFLATVYQHLNVDTHGLQFSDFSGRPIPVLNQGEAIPELCAG